MYHVSIPCHIKIYYTVHARVVTFFLGSTPSASRQHQVSSSPLCLFCSLFSSHSKHLKGSLHDIYIAGGHAHACTCSFNMCFLHTGPMQAVTKRFFRGFLTLRHPVLPTTLTQLANYGNATLPRSEESCPSVRAPDFNKAAFKGMESHFPCLQELHERSETPIRGLKGVYGEHVMGYKVFKQEKPFHFKHGGVIPELELAYEHWGELNEAKDNCILLHTGLSASSHAKSHHVSKLLYSFETVSCLCRLLPGEPKLRMVGEIHWSRGSFGH